MQRHVLLCYDISHPKRLRRVHRVVRDFGFRAQFSVFACRLTPRDRARLVARLLEEIDQRVDRVLLLDLGPATLNQAGVPGATLLGAQGLPDASPLAVV